MGFRVRGLKFRVWGLGFGIRVWSLGFRAFFTLGLDRRLLSESLRFGVVSVCGLGFGVWWVEGFPVGVIIKNS